MFLKKVLSQPALKNKSLRQAEWHSTKLLEFGVAKIIKLISLLFG